MNLLDNLKDLKIVGVHCSACDFTIEVHGDHSNRDFLTAASTHDRLYHSDNDTQYNIITELKIMKPAPITHIELKIVAVPGETNGKDETDPSP